MSMKNVKTVTRAIDLEPVLRKATPETLVLWDVNNVLLAYANPLIRSEQFRKRMFALRDRAHNDVSGSWRSSTDAQKAFWALYGEFHAKQPMEPVEPMLLSMVTNLHERGISAGVLSCVSDEVMAAARARALVESGFDRLNPHLFTFPGQNKGERLLQYLNSQDDKVREILFIDDHVHFMETVVSAAKRQGIKFTGVLFKAEVLVATQTFSEEEVEQAVQEFLQGVSK